MQPLTEQARSGRLAVAKALRLVALAPLAVTALLVAGFMLSYKLGLFTDGGRTGKSGSLDLAFIGVLLAGAATYRFLPCVAPLLLLSYLITRSTKKSLTPDHVHSGIMRTPGMGLTKPFHRRLIPPPAQEEFGYALPLVWPVLIAIAAGVAWCANWVFATPRHGLIITNAFATKGLPLTYYLACTLSLALDKDSHRRERAPPLVVVALGSAVLVFVFAVPAGWWGGSLYWMAWFASITSVTSTFDWALGLASGPAWLRTASASLASVTATAMGGGICGLALGWFESLRFPGVDRIRRHFEWMALAGALAGAAALAGFLPLTVSASLLGLYIHAWAMSQPYRVASDPPGGGVAKAWVIAAVTGAWAAYALYGAGVGPWKGLFGWYAP